MLKHRLYIYVLLFLLVSVPVFVSAEGQRGIVPIPIKDRTGNQVLLYQESHALLVGVSQYTGGWPDLPGVREDINEVKVALEQKGFHTVIVMNPTRIELRDSIENFINLYGLDVDNRLIFYFAGHGHTMESSYGEEMGYFVPANAPNPNLDKSGFLATSINMESIEVYSKKVQSKHALFLFDSCFSGSIFALSRAIPENISFKTSKPVRQFITAGSANETVPDESIFNDQLIRALNGEGDLDGDGYLTGVELGEFLNKTVINYSKGSQHPQYGKIRNPNLDKGDFVFQLASVPPYQIVTPPPHIAAPEILDSIVLLGHLQVNVNTPSAKVWVNKDFKGTAYTGNPLNLENLPIGDATIRVEADGYEPLERMVYISKNQWVQKLFRLNKKQVAIPPAPSPLTSPKLSFPSGKGKPDLSSLSEDERSAIESTCGWRKDSQGPASYYNCVRDKVSALSNAPNKPDLSSLSASERSAIESTCGWRKDSQGPASYYNCVRDKVSALGTNNF